MTARYHARVVDVVARDHFVPLIIGVPILEEWSDLWHWLSIYEEAHDGSILLQWVTDQDLNGDRFIYQTFVFIQLFYPIIRPILSEALNQPSIIQCIMTFWHPLFVYKVNQLAVVDGV